MLTTVCTLRHGKRQATARLSTASPQELGEVTYSGDVNLFPKRFERLGNAHLHQIARNIARANGTTVEVTDSGTYDWRAK